MNKRCSIIINSCDSYSDLWIPFFKLLTIQWPQCKEYPIFLNTETKKFSFPGLNITCLSLYKHDQNVSWSKRFRDTLCHIATPYVLTLLDDYFIEKSVDSNEIDNCLRWLSENPNIAVFHLYPLLNDGIESNKYKKYKLVPKKTKYRVNCQAAIWKRDFLIKFLKEDWNPWQFEIYGSYRSRKYSEDFYAFSGSVDNSAFVYFPQKSVSKGKWRNLDLCSLFKKHNINVDFNKRGIQDKKSCRKKPLLKRMKNRIYHYYLLVKAVCYRP